MSKNKLIFSSVAQENIKSTLAKKQPLQKKKKIPLGFICSLHASAYDTQNACHELENNSLKGKVNLAID